MRKSTRNDSSWLLSLFLTTIASKSWCRYAVWRWAACSWPVSSFVMIACQTQSTLWTSSRRTSTFNNIRWLSKRQVRRRKLHLNAVQSCLFVPVPVRKGEQLTTTYTNTLKTTLERRRHLRQTKIFDCDCERCRDPTELSTYGSTMVCERCGGRVCSMDPLDEASAWMCDECKSRQSHEVKARLKPRGRRVNLVTGEQNLIYFSVFVFLILGWTFHV